MKIFRQAFKIRIHQFFAIGTLKGISINQVQSTQQKMVRIDQIITNHGEITFCVYKEHPTKMENFGHGTGLSPLFSSSLLTRLLLLRIFKNVLKNVGAP